jgi:hypothetical protein
MVTAITEFKQDCSLHYFSLSNVKKHRKLFSKYLKATPFVPSVFFDQITKELCDELVVGILAQVDFDIYKS